MELMLYKKKLKNIVKFSAFVRLVKDGSVWYLVKWRDLPYDNATWENEESGITDFQKFVDDYHALRYVIYTKMKVVRIYPEIRIFNLSSGSFFIQI